MLCAFCDEPWRDAPAFFGGSDCLLVGLAPAHVACRHRRGPGATRDFAYLNTKGSPARTRGLLFGGDGAAGTARLRVPDDLGDAEVEIRDSDLAFERGPLAPAAGDRDDGGTAVYGVDAIEVWGAGDDAALATAAAGRKEARRDAAAYIQRAREVDKAAFGAGKRARKSQLQRLRSRSLSTRFG